MWGKTEQIVLWSVTYTPLIILMVFRFLISNNIYLGLKTHLINLSNSYKIVNRMTLELCFIMGIILFSYALYKITIYLYLSKYDDIIKPGEEGENYYIRDIAKFSANDYSFFLLTLLLPLISLDHSSVVNLFISILIILYVINIYVKTDAISVCPLFFFSGKEVYKAVISQGTFEEENFDCSLRKNAVLIIHKDSIDLTNHVRGKELVGSVYYISKCNSNKKTSQ
ncbi:hypothetical protein SAMN05421839_1181 [Halolactibacillus halophilus]|uniref:Uncharacterized protein n=1 Tax=Halolactibacillus halophilus TaxID=306540 RepID=A0A1I5PZX3_9BACI|nr:hypothetical protein [Halolactibacillus halophilus]GEM01924.1 hypothetical protein HHA03_14560 [Halolactibacillus halophilus]SFP39618.1 hypothetical protein SAMN05421839_1181 [Halolactibacillus halophilus]